MTRLLRKNPVYNADSNTFNVKYLEMINGNFELKKSSEYYTQCQVQMFATGLKICDLFVWSPRGSCKIEIHYDEDFIFYVIPKLAKFYVTHFLPALCEEFKENM